MPNHTYIMSHHIKNTRGIHVPNILDYLHPRAIQTYNTSSSASTCVQMIKHHKKDASMCIYIYISTKNTCAIHVLSTPVLIYTKNVYTILKPHKVQAVATKNRGEPPALPNESHNLGHCQYPQPLSPPPAPPPVGPHPVWAPVLVPYPPIGPPGSQSL